MKKKLILLLTLPLLLSSISSCSSQGVKGDKGDTGATGQQGEPGKDGSQIYTGSSTPSSSLGKTGDIYIDTNTGDLYSKSDSGWVKTGNIKGNDGTNGTDGVSIIGVSKTTSTGNVDTYTITYSNGNTSSFTVTNGVDGSQGAQGVKGEDGHTPTITIGTNGHWYVDGQDTGYDATGAKGDAGTNGKDGVSVTNIYIDEEGHLICVMSDGSKIDAGQVKDVTKFNVNFYVDDEKVKTLYNVPNGTKITTPDEEDTAGYTINYWKCKENNDEKWNFATDVVTSEINLYADFTCNDYQITYVDSKYNTAIDNLTVTYNKEYSLSTIENKTGWTFSGWKKEDGESFDLKGIYRVASDLTLYADWKVNNFTVTLDANGGNVSNDEVKITYDSSYELPDPIAPSGTYFKGWYLNDTLIPSTGDNWTYTDSDVTLVAKYYTEEDKTITYGLYPQTHVSDTTTITALDSLTTTESNGWYKYNNEYYTKVSAKPRGSNYTFNDGTRVVSGTSYWFKCEPITWKILESNNGEYSLVSNVLLDAHRYNESYDGTKNGYYANNYANSEIRLWLNNEFYNTAFNLDNSLIQTTEVDNSASTTNSSSNKYACDNTNDKVYLLSYADYNNTKYFTDSDSRKCQVTDYALANGAYMYNSIRNGYYWTRSPSSSSSDSAWYVDNYGGIYYNYVYDTYSSVRPALTIKIA